MEAWMRRLFLLIPIIFTATALASAASSALETCLAKKDLSRPACECVSGCAAKGEGCRSVATKADNAAEITNARCDSITELCQSQCRVGAESANRTTRNDVLAAVAAQALYRKENGVFLACSNSECITKLKGLTFKGQTEVSFEAPEEGQVLVGKAHSRTGTDLRYTYDSRRSYPKLRQHHEGEDLEAKPAKEAQPQ
jgi:hypothetical protein